MPLRVSFCYDSESRIIPDPDEEVQGGAQHPAIRYSLGHQHEEFRVIDGPEGTYDTLPIITTFPRESPLSVPAIRSKANRSLFLGTSIGMADCISF